MQIDSQATVGELVRQHPGLLRTLGCLGIDYSCSGGKTLAEACRERSLDVATVARTLAASAETPGDHREIAGPGRMGIGELVDHIEQTHHAYLHQELPRIGELIAKVHRAHGADRPQLGELADVFRGFADELQQHMQKEEQVLFPWIRALEGSADAPGPCETVDHPIRMLEHVHTEAGEALERMRRLTEGFRPPQGACNTYRAMLSALAELERDIHRHVYKEENMLFPRAMAAQSRARVSTARPKAAPAARSAAD